jgi:hypothetical protein
MDNKPIYKIHGKERKKLKSEYSRLDSFIRNFYHFHNLDKDM